MINFWVPESNVIRIILYDQFSLRISDFNIYNFYVIWRCHVK